MSFSGSLRAHSGDLAARIVGTGVCRPRNSVGGAALGAPFGKSADWIRERTGIRSLRRLSSAETLADLACGAATAAVADAGRRVEQIDVAIVASCSSRSGTSVGARLERVLPRATVVEMNAACAGFSYALATADAMISTGSARTVVVVGAERMSALIDPADLGTSILFADGAGAAVVTGCAASDRGIAPPAWSSDGGRAHVLTVPDGARVLRMDGPQVFRWAIQEVPAVARAACANAKVGMRDIAAFVPHQANKRIIDALVDKLGLAHATVATDIETAGNTSAASIPMAMDAIRRSSDALSGALALLVGFGAGLTISGQVVRLP